ncbi:MAG: hypothetical protein SFY69_11010 [Planctomycetota bacterium]|nr:hypothetical protein [Planctomycetota bacterium]
MRGHSATRICRLMIAGGLGAGVVLGAGLGGCSLVGAVAENYRKDATKTVEAESDVLAGRSFAVFVSAPRSVQGDFPLLVETLATRAVDRLSAGTNVPPAGGYVPAASVLRYQYNTPAWALAPKAELAEAMGGVDRLVLIEVTEYRLHAPGDAYTWDAVAAALVSVYDPRSGTPEIAIFERTVQVKFPDKRGDGPEQIRREVVQSALLSRLIDRATWPFYAHEEPYYPTY